MSKLFACARTLVCAAAAVAALSTSALAQSPGPDVTYQNITGTSNFGVVGDIRAYMFSSDTCNIGTANLRWGGSWQGSPALAQNMYRITDGRMFQIGMSWCKQACCAGATTGCGTCNGVGGTQLGAGCKDVYGASYNGGQSRLGPRSQVNAYTGAMLLAPTNSGDAILKRLQVRDRELDPSIPNTVFIGEGVYVGSDDAPAGNGLNNASWKRMTVDASTRNLTPVGSMAIGEPAIYAWRALGGPNATLDSNVNIAIVDIPGEGRLFVGSKVTPVSGGRYAYDYAIYNLNSDVSVGSFNLPMSRNAVTSTDFCVFPTYHSGEPYNNQPWVKARIDSTFGWRTPQTFAQNANSNAIRWGTMFTFGFTSNAPPISDGTVTLGLFKPHTTPSVTVAGVTVPGPVCGTADFNQDAATGTDADIEAFFACLAGNCCANCQSADFNDDGDHATDADIEAFFRVLAGQAC